MEDAQMTSRLLDELANGNGNSFWAASESTDTGVHPFAHGLDVHAGTAVETLPDSFESQAGHLCMFIKPQIALQSDADDKSTIILTAFRAQLKVYSVIDTRIPDDPVNAQVLHQTFAVLDGLQAFYPREQNRVVGGGLIFVPLETLVDLRVEPWGFDRVVPRTAAALRYDKFNQLRIGSKGTASGIMGPGTSESHLQSGTDRIAVECEKFSVSANPDHFAAIYNVVTDLLLYSDPLQKMKSKQLEEIVFTRDFSDLTHAIDVVKSLQSRLRAISNLGQEYQVHLDQLDEEGRLELFHGRAEFVRLSNELNLVVQAITRAQVFNGASAAGTTAGIQFEARAFELVWHMLDKSDIPFAKFSVDGLEFSWTSKQDSSISNRLVIKDLKALNSSPDHIFTEIIAKSEEVADHELATADIFAAILWNSLPPVGGISIVEQFEVHLHPIRLQLEHRVGRQILDYVFSQRRKLADDEPATEKKPPTKVSRPIPTPLASSAGSFMRSTDSLSFHKNNSRLTLSSDIASRSTLDVPSTTSSFSALRRVNSSTTELMEEGLEEGLDADEMRLRAALFRTFILVEFTSTVLSLSYRVSPIIAILRNCAHFASSFSRIKVITVVYRIFTILRIGLQAFSIVERLGRFWTCLTSSRRVSKLSGERFDVVNSHHSHFRCHQVGLVSEDCSPWTASFDSTSQTSHASSTGKGEEVAHGLHQESLQHREGSATEQIGSTNPKSPSPHSSRLKLIPASQYRSSFTLFFLR